MKFFLIHLSLLFSITAFSQQYSFRRYDVKGGLSQNTVWCEFQDSKGFIWFGTKDGLNRFDGRNFKVFRKKNGDSTSIGNNFIHSIWEDNQQHLWIGTDKGIYIYDPLKETFHFFNKKTKNNIFITGIINTITKDYSGNIWIAAYFDGVFKYNISTDKLTFYQNDPHNSQSLSSNLAWTVYCDSKGKIWVGTHMGGLCRYNSQNDSFTRYIPGKTTNINDDNIYSIYEDSQSNFWIGTSKGGLNLMDRQAGTFEHYPIGNKKNELSNSTVRCIIEIFPGKLFFGTENGLNDFELKTQVFNASYNSLTNPKSITDNAIYSLYKDKENNIWIGTYFGGVNCLSFNQKSFEHYYPTNSPNQLNGKAVSVFCEDKKCNLWIATEDGGLNYFNTLTKNFTHFSLPEQSYNIHALLIDGDELWTGNFYSGIVKINLKTKTLKHYNYNPSDTNSLGFSNIFSLYKDNTENIWVGGINGLCKYNRAKDNFIRIKNLGLEHIYIYDIFQDNLGNIWFASYNDGIFRYNPKSNKWKNYRHQTLDKTSPGNDKIISIYQDQQNRLWFGTEGAGLCQYIYEKDCFKTYDKENNLPNNVIYSILDDGQNLWISSNNGLTRFNPETLEARTYYESDGLQSNQFNYKSGYKTHDGKMYFGGINGFNAFYPHQLKDNKYIPPVVITDFQILNKQVPVGVVGSPLQKSITYSDEITLAYNQSVFSLEFVALSYLAPENNQYAYQLEGVDKNWNYSRERKLIYAGLPPGTYTLKIKASNNDGQWNNDGTSLRITVLPPFWKSNMALFIYVVFIILIFSASGYNLNKRYKNRNQKRIEKLHLEKEKELNRMKIDFFTNIAHEIRSPLTLITGPLDHLIASGKGTVEVKDDYKIMKRNVQRLITLVNQLLDFRKIESNHYIIRFSKTDIVSFTKNIYERFIHLAKEKNIEFIFNAYPENYETIIPTEALTSIIGNLLSNAFKFTTNKIELSLKILNKNYIITVTDNGSGIQPGESEKIFLPFYQEASKKNTQKYIEGTGIGLAYVKSLVDMIEGKIMIDQEYSNGAKFIVNIPFKDCTNIKLDQYDQNNSSAIINKIKGDISLQTPVNSTKEKEPAIRELTEKSTILIVEDQDEMLHFIARLFKQNYTVFKAKNGLDALKIIEEEEIDLVISDIMMPEMDGLELCTKLKSEFETCHIPVILLTAKNTNESKIEGLKQGADAYIEKPFEYEHLFIQVNNLLDNRRKLKLHFIKEPFVKTNEIVSSQHDEQFVLTIENLIMDKLPDPDFSIDELASEMHISRSGFHKKLKGITGLTPNDFIKLIRMKKAAELLTTTDYRINEICYMTGFNSPSYFAKCFQEQFGVLPTDFQKKSKKGKTDKTISS